MRLVYALLFFLTLPIQHPVVTRVNAPDVTITGFGWATPPSHQAPATPQIRREPPIDIQRNDYPPLPSKTPDSLDSVPSLPPPAAEPKPAIIIGVKNSGSRDIKAVSWEVIFSDRKTTDEYLHLTFETKRRVRSGESLMLDYKFRNKSEWERLQQAVMNQSAAVTVKITRLQYADGTSWKP